MQMNRRQFLVTAGAAVAAADYDYEMELATRQAELVADAKARALEAQGWEAWYSAVFGADFVSALAAHHREAIEWHWNAVTAMLKGERPDSTAYFSPWSRSHMKSTIARRIAVCSAARRRRGYCLYVGGTKNKVTGHALSIKALLELPKLREFYPLLGQISQTEHGNSKGDRANFTFTKHGYVFHFVSLDEGVAGANVEDVRPTEIFMDDVDDRNDSPDVAEKRLNTLTTSVLPTKQKDTLFFFAQNLIHDFSIATRILRNEVRVLVNRKPTKPIPAIADLKTEVRTEWVEGVEVVRDVVLSGTPTWHLYGLDRAQQDIDDVGLPAFLKEYQHEVNKDRLGLVLPEWDEKVHVITWSQFEAVYGCRSIPADWPKMIGHDWGNTHPCVVSATTVASVRSKRPGLHFLFAGIEAPTNSAEDHVAELIINRFFPYREVNGRWEGVNTTLLHNLDPEDIARWQTGRLGELHNAPRELAQQTVKKRVDEELTKDRSWQVWNMSHEQKQRCKVYNDVYGLPFQQINPGAAGGIDELRRMLRVDYKQPHPFKPGEMGYAGFYLIVDDDQYYEMGVGGLVSQAKDDKGLKLWRYQIPRYRWQDIKLTESGLRPDTKPLKIHDDCANCLVGETAIKTLRGDLPIRLVRAGDYVMTRYGWRLVEVSERTGVNQPVLTVECSDGRTLRGTAEHPVFVPEKGWIPLCCLLDGDILKVWEKEKLSNLTATDFTAIPTVNTKLIAGIFSHIFTRVERALVRCTSRFGKLHTVKCPPVATSTTKTKIRPITPWIIWNVCLSLIISLCTPKSRPRLSDWRSWKEFVRLVKRGIHHLKVWSGIEITPGRALTTISHSLRSAISVVWNTLPRCETVCTAPSSALYDNELAWTLPRWSTSARGVDSRLTRLSRTSKNDSAPQVVVRRIIPSGRADVYNLQVAEHPEFFANGILVHNSMMMIYSEAGMVGPGKYSKEEQVEIQLPANYRADKLSETIQGGGAGAFHAYQDTKHDIRQELENKLAEGRRTATGNRPIRTLRNRNGKRR